MRCCTMVRNPGYPPSPDSESGDLDRRDVTRREPPPRAEDMVKSVLLRHQLTRLNDPVPL
jgi:hypothetical protein